MISFSRSAESMWMPNDSIDLVNDRSPLPFYWVSQFHIIDTNIICTKMKLTTLSLITLNVLIGLLSTVESSIITTFLPTVDGTLLSLVYQVAIPLITILTVVRLGERLRLFDIFVILVSIISLTGVHICVLPLIEYIILWIWNMYWFVYPRIEKVYHQNMK